jgi:hypothetical protein
MRTRLSGESRNGDAGREEERRDEDTGAVRGLNQRRRRRRKGCGPVPLPRSPRKGWIHATAARERIYAATVRGANPCRCRGRGERGSDSCCRREGADSRRRHDGAGPVPLPRSPREGRTGAASTEGSGPASPREGYSRMPSWGRE